MSCRYRLQWLFPILLLSFVPVSRAESPVATQSTEDASLQFVVYLTRHGVRSPTGKSDQYQKFSTASWPTWDVPPGHLTAHGYSLMKLFGEYDRIRLAGEGVLASSGCADAGRVAIFADSDERTRQTGKAIAEGLLPGCAVEVHAQPEGSADPLFHFLEAQPGQVDYGLAAAAIAGRIGGDANALTEAYRAQLNDLDHVLSGCGIETGNGSFRASIFDIASSLAPGSGDHPAELRGPLSTASTLSEILLLEYTEGMSAAKVGWGCADGGRVRELIQLHSAASDFAQRTPAVARMFASNLLDHIGRALAQSATGKTVIGAPGKPGDRVLILVGHDTNIATVAGALGLTWIVDGRRDDTPPGGSLIFALWRSRKSGDLSVRVSYTAQTLEEMHELQVLSRDHPPAEVPVFVPGCGKTDGSCEWSAFQATIQKAVDAKFIR